MIELDRIGYRYAERLALDEVSASIAAGRRTALIGASGSGKTTAALCAAGILQPSAGRVLLDGQPIASDRRRAVTTVACVFQSPQSQMLAATVADELAMPLECLGRPRADVIRAVAGVARAYDLGPLLERSPATLSGGEMQRVALAVGLTTEPRVLVLDEPLAYLDAEARAEIDRRLEALAASGDVAQLRVEPLPVRADWTVILAGGRAVEAGSTLTAEWDDRLRGTSVTVPGLTYVTEPAPMRLVAARLNVGWDAPVASDLELTLAPGSLVTLSGRSGSGKTTLLLTLAGLIAPLAGSIRLGEGGASDRRQRRRHVSYVPQFPERFFWRATVADEVAGHGAATQGEVAQELAALDLPEELGARSPFALSGGQRRRVALACALRARRPVVLLDEPAAGLDGAGRRYLGAILDGLRAAGAGVLVSTHDAELHELADCRLHLADGRLLEV